MKSLSEFIFEYKKGEKVFFLSETRGFNLAYFLYKLTTVNIKKRVLVCPSDKALYDLYDEMSFYYKKTYGIPSKDTSFYGSLNPSPEITGEVIASLYRLLNDTEGIFVLSAKTMVEPVIPVKILKKNYIYLLAGEDFNYDDLKQLLPVIGYQRVDHVEMPGDYAVKGGIIDVYSPYLELPVRIEFFGDYVESLRLFEPSNQRSIKNIDECIILPIKDLIFDEATKKTAIESIKKYSDIHGIMKKHRDLITEKILNNTSLGYENYLLPLVYGDETNILNYLNDCEIIVLRPEEVKNNIKKYYDEQLNAWMHKKEEMFAPCPEDVIKINIFQDILDKAALIVSSFSEKENPIQLDFVENFEIKYDVEEIKETKEKKHPIERLISIVKKKCEIFKILIVAYKEFQAKKIYDLLIHYGLTNIFLVKDFEEFVVKSEIGKVFITAGELNEGFKNFSDQIWVITENDIFGKKERKLEKKKDITMVISDLYELNEGDLVVHINHGIGIYRGLKQVEVLGKKGEYLELEYADSDKLFVPVHKIHYVQKYIASEDYIAKVDKLGEKRWQRIKNKIKADLKNWAEEIIRVEALRKSQSGFKFNIDTVALDEFAASFEYEETQDQAKAIEDTLKDMESDKPMDRLICGDVGFGKTEVALRAAFVAASAKKQVCLIAPTTILAEQHFSVFKKRLEPFGIKVGLISRFIEKEEQKKIIERIKKNEIDVVIGTHRLLSKDVQFSDLGLLIIDEEQKFGVAHKEKIKNLKATVDILTLTATPIPRTLYMSVSGLKEISLIVSPPKGRQSIKTYVTTFSESVVKDAVEREIQRGGQIFFVHNRVKSMRSMIKYLQRLFPTLKIAVAHGQMDESELKNIMENFKEGKFHILLSTAIIESGLDMPNANAIIINRADKFGLADLYQLRGRVGRSNRKAYAYLLVPSFEGLTKDAQKRLKVIQELEELGTGFKLAIHDLEIRGAGDILGKKQSGHINEVGLELYLQLLDEAIKEIRYERGEIVLERKVETDMKLPYAAYIPEWYMPSTRERLEFYKRILAAKNKDDIEIIQSEFEDRFGNLPMEVSNFLSLKELELLLSEKGCRECHLQKGNLVIVFDEQFFPPKSVINEIFKKFSGIKFVVPDKFYLPFYGKEKDFAEVKKILQDFLESVKINR